MPRSHASHSHGVRGGCEMYPVMSQQVTQLANQMSNVEERLGAHGADIRNLKDSISQLNTSLHNQSARIDMRQTELLNSINALRDEIHATAETAAAQRAALEERVDDLEHAKTYSKGVITTVRWLAAAVAAVFVSLVSIIMKLFFNN